MMIRIVAISSFLVLGTAAETADSAAAGSSWSSSSVGGAVRTIRLQHQKRRKLSTNEIDQNGEYFCNCPCDDTLESDESALVWVGNGLSVESILSTTYFTHDDVLEGKDEEGDIYQGFCLTDDDVFELLYGYGNDVFCDDECEQGEDAPEKNGYVDLGDSLASEVAAAEVDSENQEPDSSNSDDGSDDQDENLEEEDGEDPDDGESEEDFETLMTDKTIVDDSEQEEESLSEESPVDGEEDNSEGEASQDDEDASVADLEDVSVSDELYDEDFESFLVAESDAMSVSADDADDEEDGVESTSLEESDEDLDSVALDVSGDDPTDLESLDLDDTSSSNSYSSSSLEELESSLEDVDEVEGVYPPLSSEEDANKDEPFEEHMMAATAVDGEDTPSLSLSSSLSLEEAFNEGSELDEDYPLPSSSSEEANKDESFDEHLMAASVGESEDTPSVSSSSLEEESNEGAELDEEYPMPSSSSQEEASKEEFFDENMMAATAVDGVSLSSSLEEESAEGSDGLDEDYTSSLSSEEEDKDGQSFDEHMMAATLGERN